MTAKADCPNAAEHTVDPDEPAGYLAWHEWVEQKVETHRQVRCVGCGRYAIWVPKRPRTTAPSAPEPKDTP